jgi:hypothetical protein
MAAGWTDVEGRGPFVVAQPRSLGVVRVNSNDKSIGFAYVRRSTLQPWYYGLNASGAATNSIASIFSKGMVQPKAQVTAYIGKVDLLTDASKPTPGVDWAHLRIGYEGTRVVLIRPESTYAAQVSRSTFEGVDAALSYNRLVGGSFIWSVSAGYRRTSNLEDLPEVEVETTVEAAGAPAGTSRDVRSVITARRGEFRGRDTYPVSVDLFLKPDPAALIGFSAYGRQTLAKGKPTSRLGAGVWLLKEKTPAQAVGGLVVEFDDVFRTQPESTDQYMEKRLAVSLVAALPLFNR